MLPGKDLFERMWLRVSFHPSGCILYTGSLNRDGYGSVGLRRSDPVRETLAHRISWLHFNGPIPDGLSVLHKCDVPACVNSEHFFLGTQAANVADQITKGRHANQCKTHCVNGHPFDDVNTKFKISIQSGNEVRYCGACNLESGRRLRVQFYGPRTTQCLHCDNPVDQNLRIDTKYCSEKCKAAARLIRRRGTYTKKPHKKRG